MSERPEDRRRLGPAWHRRVGGLHVLKVQGSAYEMGRQHGTLLRDAIPRGPLPYYRRYLARLLGSSGLEGLAPFASWLLQQTVGRIVLRKAPPYVLETLRGLADGSGYPHRQVLEGCTLFDSLLWVVSRILRLRGSQAAVEHRIALELGCSSAIAWGDATRDGRLLHGRNFDYPGVGTWTAEPAVIFHEPDDGLRYASVSAAGVPLGGATAMNEAGLTLTVHQHMFTAETELGGTPIGVVGDLVMKRARSLDDAQRLLEAHRPIGCWTYLIADGHRREVLCYEESPRRHAALRSSAPDTTFRYANIFLDPALGATERNLYGSYWRANQGRYQRLGERLQEAYGALDASEIASILGDVGGEGESCRIRRAIAMLLTVGSVVFRPEDGVFWVATGETPVSHNRYEPFDLGSEDHAPGHGALAGALPEESPARAAFDAYRDAYLATFDRGDVAGGRRALERARALQPGQPLYHFAAGILALADGDARGALAALGRALELSHPDPERVAAFHLWRGRAHDLAGERARAIADYRAALSVGRIDGPVEQAARRGLGRAYARRSARRVHLDFAFADVVSP